jgi:hypothetical protein
MVAEADAVAAHAPVYRGGRHSGRLCSRRRRRPARPSLTLDVAGVAPRCGSGHCCGLVVEGSEPRQREPRVESTEGGRRSEAEGGNAESRPMAEGAGGGVCGCGTSSPTYVAVLRRLGK